MHFKYTLILFFLIPSIVFCQKKYEINITSAGNTVEFPYAYIKNSTIKKYGNKDGELIIETKSENDTLRIETIGYEPKDVVLKNKPNILNIELQENADILEEITISIHNNEKSNWKKINKKTKKTNETNYFGLPEGFILMSSYKVEKETKFNGIRFFLVTKSITADINFNKKIRPIIIINSSDLLENKLPNKIIYLDKDVDLFTKLDIEFSNTIHLLPNETLTIGLELIPEDINNLKIDNIIAVLTTNNLLAESKTITHNLFSKSKESNKGIINEDIYFELKVVK